MLVGDSGMWLRRPQKQGSLRLAMMWHPPPVPGVAVATRGHSLAEACGMGYVLPPFWQSGLSSCLVWQEPHTPCAFVRLP